MKILLLLMGPFLFCVGVAFVVHFWDVISRRGKLTPETHRRGAVLFWALICSAYLAEVALKIQSFLLQNGFPARTSHHIFGILLVFVSIAAAGVIDLVSKNQTEAKVSAR